MSTMQAFDVKVSMKDVFNRFKADFDAVRNQREQRELLEGFVMQLETWRKQESSRRDFTAAQVTKNMLKVVREELTAIAIRFENVRQEKENKGFKAAAAVTNKEIMEAEDERLEEVFDTCGKMQKQQEELHRQQRDLLEREISRIKVPRARYTKGTLELRHAEKLLSQQQDYFNASLVRARTKKLEAEEDRATFLEHQRKMQHKRDKLEKSQDFENKRLFEDLKQRRAVGKRSYKAAVKLGKDKVSFIQSGMIHGHCMNMHKVKGTTHNIELEPRKLSHETQRGSAYKEIKIGKPHLAIPSLSATHLFDVKPVLVEKGRPQTASPVPNFRDPVFRMTARLEACRPQSRALGDSPMQHNQTASRPASAAQ